MNSKFFLALASAFLICLHVQPAVSGVIDQNVELAEALGTDLEAFSEVDLIRSKRQTTTDLNQMIRDIINGIIEAQIKLFIDPIKATVNLFFDTAITIVQTFVLPGDNVLILTINTVLLTVIDVIKLIRAFIDNLLEAFNLQNQI